jgi:predicted transcriptional regulator
MSMGIVSDEEFESELSNKSIKKEVIDNVIRKPFHGRHSADNNVPSIIREIVADTSGNQKEIAESLGISHSSVSAYQHGATSTASYDRGNDRLKEVVNNRRERIGRKSSKALMNVLDKMNAEAFDAKLDACKATELSVVAANLSRVVEKVATRPESQSVQNNIVFYTPTPLKNDNFEVIDLGRKTIDVNTR